MFTEERERWGRLMGGKIRVGGRCVLVNKPLNRREIERISQTKINS